MQQTGILETFDVGQIAQTGQSEHLQEFPRRDIGVRCAEFRRARAGGDEIEALQAADDITADFLADEARQFRAGGRLQIGDRGDGEQFGRRQLRGSSVFRAIVRRANGAGVARFRAKLPAAGDLDQVIGPCAKFVDNVGDKIIECREPVWRGNAFSVKSIT